MGDTAAARGYLTPEMTRLCELTGDAVAVCAPDGTICDANDRFSMFGGMSDTVLCGTDIKDLLFSPSFERSDRHGLPFETDGSESALMLKLPDGSFIPVAVRAGVLAGNEAAGAQGSSIGNVIVVVRSEEERQAHGRERRRLLDELSAVNRRLSGTLSIIMATMGSESLPELLQTVLDQLSVTLDAKGSVIYFAENGGFMLRGASATLADEHAPAFVPYGAGVPTQVVREGRSLRLASLSSASADSLSSIYLDLDSRHKHRFALQSTPPYKALIASPIFYGTRVLGIIECGWDKPYAPRENDVHVLEVICEYLSIELMELIGAVRSQRRSDLARSLSRVREALFASDADLESIRRRLYTELAGTLSCKISYVRRDSLTDEDYLDFGSAGRLLLPRNIDPLFFSNTAPAVRIQADQEGLSSSVDEIGSYLDGDGDDIADRLEIVRLARVDQATPAGEWLREHGLPTNGVFVDFGIDDARRHGMLLYRPESSDPIDDMEYDYVAHMMHDYELCRNGLAAKREEGHIAQALQRGMESTLQEVPGITSDSLYSSATRQALVGGDFFELIRLPDDCAVMILGDVSGKGVEAASMSALVKTALSAYAWEGMTPARMVRALNGMLLSFSRVETFATMFVARLDLRTGTAVYCSAGHPPAMVYRAGSRPEVEMLSCQSGVVGAFPDMRYLDGRFTFEKGDMLFLYTDGAIEARDAAGRFFGEGRLQELFLSIAPQGIHGICQRVLHELDVFTGSALNDDIALVSLRFDRARLGVSADNGDRAASKRASASDHAVREGYTVIEEVAPRCAAQAVPDASGEGDRRASAHGRPSAPVRGDLADAGDGTHGQDSLIRRAGKKLRGMRLPLARKNRRSR